MRERAKQAPRNSTTGTKPGKRNGAQQRRRNQANATEPNNGRDARRREASEGSKTHPQLTRSPPQTPRSRPGGGKKRRGTLCWRRGSGARRIPTRLATDRGQPGGPPVVCSVAFSHRAAVTQRTTPADFSANMQASPRTGGSTGPERVSWPSEPWTR